VLRRATPAFARVESERQALELFFRTLFVRAAVPPRVFGSRARASASRSRRGAGVACFLSRVRAPGWPPGARGDREVAGLAAVACFSRQRAVPGPTPLCALPRHAYPSLGSSYRGGVPSPDGVFARDMRSGERLASCRSGERLASCVRSFEPSLTRSSCILSYNCIAVMGSAKSAVRLKLQRVLRRLGLPPHSSGAQLRVGDVRDAKRVEHLLKTFMDTTKIPGFLTVPISDWCATPPPLSIRASGFRSS
jgi:hypothetical protein